MFLSAVLCFQILIYSVCSANGELNPPGYIPDFNSYPGINVWNLLSRNGDNGFNRPLPPRVNLKTLAKEGLYQYVKKNPAQIVNYLIDKQTNSQVNLDSLKTQHSSNRLKKKLQQKLDFLNRLGDHDDSHDHNDSHDHDDSHEHDDKVYNRGQGLWYPRNLGLESKLVNKVDDVEDLGDLLDLSPADRLKLRQKLLSGRISVLYLKANSQENSKTIDELQSNSETETKFENKADDVDSHDHDDLVYKRGQGLWYPRNLGQESKLVNKVDDVEDLGDLLDLSPADRLKLRQKLLSERISVLYVKTNSQKNLNIRDNDQSKNETELIQRRLSLLQEYIKAYSGETFESLSDHRKNDLLRARQGVRLLLHHLTKHYLSTSEPVSGSENKKEQYVIANQTSNSLNVQLYKSVPQFLQKGVKQEENLIATPQFAEQVNELMEFIFTFKPNGGNSTQPTTEEEERLFGGLLNKICKINLTILSTEHSEEIALELLGFLSEFPYNDKWKDTLLAKENKGLFTALLRFVCKVNSLFNKPKPLKSPQVQQKENLIATPQFSEQLNELLEFLSNVEYNSEWNGNLSTEQEASIIEEHLNSICQVNMTSLDYSDREKVAKDLLISLSSYPRKRTLLDALLPDGLYFMGVGAVCKANSFFNKPCTVKSPQVQQKENLKATPQFFRQSNEPLEFIYNVKSNGELNGNLSTEEEEKPFGELLNDVCKVNFSSLSTDHSDMIAFNLLMFLYNHPYNVTWKETNKANVFSGIFTDTMRTLCKANSFFNKPCTVKSPQVQQRENLRATLESVPKLFAQVKSARNLTSLRLPKDLDLAQILRKFLSNADLALILRESNAAHAELNETLSTEEQKGIISGVANAICKKNWNSLNSQESEGVALGLLEWNFFETLLSSQEDENEALGLLALFSILTSNAELNGTLLTSEEKGILTGLLHVGCKIYSFFNKPKSVKSPPVEQKENLRATLESVPKLFAQVKSARNLTSLRLQKDLDLAQILRKFLSNADLKEELKVNFTSLLKVVSKLNSAFNVGTVNPINPPQIQIPILIVNPVIIPDYNILRVLRYVPKHQNFISIEERINATKVKNLASNSILVESQRLTVEPVKPNETVTTSEPYIQTEEVKQTETVPPTEIIITRQSVETSETVTTSEPYRQTEEVKQTETVPPTEIIITRQSVETSETVTTSEPYRPTEEVKQTETVPSSEIFTTSDLYRPTEEVKQTETVPPSEIIITRQSVETSETVTTSEPYRQTEEVKQTETVPSSEIFTTSDLYRPTEEVKQTETVPSSETVTTSDPYRPTEEVKQTETVPSSEIFTTSDLYRPTEEVKQTETVPSSETVTTSDPYRPTEEVKETETVPSSDIFTTSYPYEPTEEVKQTETVPSSEIFTTSDLYRPTEEVKQTETVPSSEIFTTSDLYRPTEEVKQTETVPSSETVTTSDPYRPTEEVKQTETVPSSEIFTTSDLYRPTEEVKQTETVPSSETVTTSDPYRPTEEVKETETVPSSEIFTTSYPYGPTDEVKQTETVPSSETVTTSDPYGTTEEVKQTETVPTSEIFTTSYPYGPTEEQTETVPSSEIFITFELVETSETVTTSEPYRPTEEVKQTETVPSSEIFTTSYPYGPTDEVKQTETVPSSETVTTSDPYGTTEEVKQTETVPSNETITTSEPYESSETVPTSEPVESSETVTTSEPYRPTEEVKQIETLPSSEPSETVTTSEPFEPSETVLSSEPVEPSETVSPSEPVEHSNEAKKESVEYWQIKESAKGEQIESKASKNAQLKNEASIATAGVESFPIYQEQSLPTYFLSQFSNLGSKSNKFDNGEPVLLGSSNQHSIRYHAFSRAG